MAEIGLDVLADLPHLRLPLCGSDRLHEHDPVRFRRLAAAIAEQRLPIGQGQDLPDTDFVFVLFENQRSIGFQDAEALAETGADIITPVLAELAIFQS
ncbi:hypothetical protein O4J55_24775 [Paracoccus sp. PXZ]|uniref:hypothetical protein n=1 Tax=Paracoccus sp. MKU1 TaxID=1745182 RepID=UPI00193EA36D|nr:hypothetical protein [Paracoccus sp. MKU1]